MKRILFAALAVVLIMSVFTACAAGTDSVSGETASVTDMTGAEVVVPASAERVVVLTPGDCEIVYALGAGDSVVGRGAYCDKPAEVFDVEEVESGTEMNLEQILALDPDVVIVNCMAQTLDCVDELQKNGIAVVQTNAESIDGVYEAITLIGKVLGKSGEADELIASMKKGFEDAAASAEKLSGKSIYFEISPLEYGLYTAGKNTFMDEIAEMFGLENVFSDIDGWASISEEQIIERNPDYILTISYDGADMTAVEEIMSREAWQDISAVKNGNVFQIIDNSLARPSQELVTGAEELAGFLNGK